MKKDKGIETQEVLDKERKDKENNQQQMKLNKGFNVPLLNIPAVEGDVSEGLNYIIVPPLSPSLQILQRMTLSVRVFV